ncbi:hypothetical protein V502_00795 [Pseudogymnoascus sp. VKM F-4520 (FW-2644)]|nr:hypothetical protein V502_00795 [Pseudogymnoascus sp. VKM F-4520 (FW-2644)]
MPVIQECLHSPTKTCGFNCWYFWNVGKSPALRRQEIAEARYGRVLAWQGVVNPTEASSVEEQQTSDEEEGSETLAEAFGSTESRSLQNVASEPSGQPEVVGMEEQGFDSSTRPGPANGPKGESHGPEPEVSDHGILGAPPLNHIAEQLGDLGGGIEADGIEGRVELLFMKEEWTETEELDAQVGPSNIELEGGSLGKEAVEEGNEEWAF